MEVHLQRPKAISLFLVRIYGFSHCMEVGSGQVQGMRLGLIGPIILYRNVHTGLKRTGTRAHFSYCGSPVHCTCPSSVPVQCE